MGKGRRREAAALVIGQPEAASRPLFLEDAVLLHQVLDDALLVPSAAHAGAAMLR